MEYGNHPRAIVVDIEPDLTGDFDRLEALANNATLASLGGTSLTTFEALALTTPTPDTIYDAGSKPEKTGHWTNLGGENKQRDSD